MTHHGKIRIVDCTLRDGSHAIGQQFTLDQIAQIASGLDKAGVWAVAVGHGDGLGASSLQFWRARHSDAEMLSAAAATLENAILAAPLLPGIGTKRDLVQAKACGLGLVRISTVCTEADIGLQHIGLARELGLVTHSHLNMAHLLDPAGMAKQARLVADAGATCIYICDTAGALVPHAVRATIAAMREAVPSDVELGMHAHHNLSLAVANSLAAIDEGATVIDTTLAGMGAGAGNTQTEVLVAVLEKQGVDTGCDLWALQDMADLYVRSKVMTKPLTVDRLTATMGYAGVPASFLLHVERAAERFDVDPRDVIVAVGRDKAVSGQEEDSVLQSASLLARRKR